MADTAGTGEIPVSGGKTPGDILMENLLNSVVGPTVNGILDVSATTTGSGTKTGTSTTGSEKTETGTKTGGTSLAAQALINQQIADLQAQLQGGDAQYKDLISNILTNAAHTFNPTNATSRRSGAYNSTTLDFLRNDAQARATASAADAVLSDKRAKLGSLVSLIEQNAQINKLENTSATGTGTSTTTGNEASTDTKNIEANRIGKGAANAAKVAGAALLAKQFLGNQDVRNLTSAGISALKKLFDLSGETSSGVLADPSIWTPESMDQVFKIISPDGVNYTPKDIQDAISQVFGPNSSNYDFSPGGFLSGGSGAGGSLPGFYTDPWSGLSSGSGSTLGTGAGDSLSGFYKDSFGGLSSGTTSGSSSLMPTGAGTGAGVGSFSSAIGAGASTALVNAADGEWGGNDLGSTVGATFGSYFGPIGSSLGSWLGGAVGESGLDGTEKYLANSGGGLITGDASLKDVVGSGFGVGDIWNTDTAVVSNAFNAVGDLFDGGCFITTACMKALKSDFKDDCWELVAIRKVRDDYIAKLEEGPALIAAYEQLAPRYVQQLEALPDSKAVWAKLYADFILPAASYANSGEFKSAYLSYLLLMLRTQELISGVA